MTSAIIVAAGKGMRMGANVDKLFLEVAGRPVIALDERQIRANLRDGDAQVREVHVERGRNERSLRVRGSVGRVVLL